MVNEFEGVEGGIDKGPTLNAFYYLAQTNVAAARMLDGVDPTGAGHDEITQLFSQIRKDIEDADRRARTETIRVGILGGRGSGKSTLANALMGDSILPESAIIFCTSLPTTIRYSDRTVLAVESELKEFNYNERNITNEEMKEILNSLCKESENAENAKKVTGITIGIPQGILAGKEIVDVPGFTKGNPLHQAFAERYAKHYCDVCLVLINNTESVEIGPYQGLEALSKTFADRLDSTVFIVNKCDQGEANEIGFIKNNLMKHFPANRPLVFELSAKNSLKGSGGQYQFAALLGHLNLLSSRRIPVLVRALLGRLITNFKSLIELCQLTDKDLDDFHRDVTRLQSELDQRLAEFMVNLRANALSRDDVPVVVVADLDLSAVNPLGVSPFEYAAQLVDQIRGQTIRIEESVQQRQAQIFRSFNQ